jgi:signal transduction histidine kinase
MPTRLVAVYRAVVPRLSSGRLVDALLVLLVSIQLIELVVARTEDVSVSVVVLVIAATGVLLLRRRTPVAAALLSLGGFAALLQLMPSTPASTFLALLVSVVVLGSLPGGARFGGLVGAWAVALEGAWLDPYGGGLSDFVLSAAIMTGAWTCGLLVARGIRAMTEASEQVAAAEEARQQAAAEAVREERARMTRELHDVLAHTLTVLVVQSVAAQEDLAHGDVNEHLAARLRASEELARESLKELRALLGILGPASDAASTVRGLDGVRSMVERLGQGGIAVQLDVQGEMARLGPGLELAIHRIVQEAVTNALRHGPGDRGSVAISCGAEAVEIVVENPIGAPRTDFVGAGRGLAGLRERVHLHGGSLVAGREGDCYRLRCVLPVPAPDEDRGSATSLVSDQDLLTVLPEVGA